MILYYITDRTQLGGDEPRRRARLLERIAAAAAAGVDYIQLREKDLNARELERLAREALEAVRRAGSRTRLLVNSRVDVAIAAGAHGVHLPSGDIPPGDARAVLVRAGMVEPVVGVSCHSLREVSLAESGGADLAVFGPVFEKRDAAGAPQPGSGVGALRAACHRRQAASPPVPVLALGGVTVENAAACVAAGAAGIAGIRLFQQREVKAVVEALKSGAQPSAAAPPSHKR